MAILPLLMQSDKPEDYQRFGLKKPKRMAT